MEDLVASLLEKERLNEHDVVACEIKRNFPFLLKHMPRITSFDKFIIKNILHITSHIEEGDIQCQNGFVSKQIGIWFTYRYPFCKKEHYLI